MANDKLKLSDTGAEALRSWMARRSVTLVELGDAIPGAHPMAVSRWCKRQGLLTLEQLGHLVAYAAGELTAEMLVGIELASAVPTYPLRQAKRRVVSSTASSAAAGPGVGSGAGSGAGPGAGSGAGFARPASDEQDGEPLPEGVDRNKAVLAQLRDDEATAPGVRADCAMKLARLGILEAGAEREKERLEGVREVDLIEKFNTLLFNARRQWSEGRGGAAGGAAGGATAAGAGVAGGPVAGAGVVAGAGPGPGPGAPGVSATGVAATGVAVPTNDGGARG